MKPDRLSDKLDVVVVSKPTGKGDSSVAAEMLAEDDETSNAIVFDAEGRLVSVPRVRPVPGKPGEPKRQG